MKRLANIYKNICDYENLKLADKNARKGKGNQYGIKIHDRNTEYNLKALQQGLFYKTYKPSPYQTFKIYEPKERLIFKSPYIDRILHHAIMLQLESPFVKAFTVDTYSCIKGRGIHLALYKVKKALQDEPGTQYCLKIDICKFYPSIDHDVLKMLLRRKFKDPDLLWLLDLIIDNAPGLPIGSYLSQYLANFYLSGFDHWIKEVKKVKYYFRYADDIVVLSDNKEYLHELRKNITEYLETLCLQVKGNYQVFPVESRSIDFLGYCIRHKYVLLRKTIKLRYIVAMRVNPCMETIAAYNGWLIHCNSINLVRKYAA